MAAESLSFPFQLVVLKSCWKVTQNGLCENSSEKDCDNNERALAVITLMVEPSNFSHVANAVTAKDAWDSLMAAYVDSGLICKVELLKTLVQLKPKRFQSVQNYVNKLVMTSITLQNVDLNVGDELVASLLLAG